MKLAAVSRAMSRHSAEIDDYIVHTGQHYDANMSELFFDELEIPRPSMNLAVSGGSHAEQTARMLEGLEAEIVKTAPDIVVVYGDTNSTLAGALAAAKLCIPVAHVEAGLRSFDRAMPEEVNRVVTDHISDILFVPTEAGVENLRKEGVDNVLMVGDVMLDALLHYRRLAQERPAIDAGVDRSSAYGMVTIHRAGNTDTERLGQLLEALNDVAAKLPLIFPVHPRTRGAIAERYASWRPHSALSLIDPISYLDLLNVVDGASVVLTDSGGLQKEAFALGTPCVTLRDETEWVETQVDGANAIVGCDKQAVIDAVDAALRRDANWRDSVMQAAAAAYGGGAAADRIVDELVKWKSSAASRS